MQQNMFKASLIKALISFLLSIVDEKLKVGMQFAQYHFPDLIIHSSL